MCFISFCVMIAPEVATVLEAVPEFAERFLELVESVDGDPGAPAAFTELADFVASLVSSPDSPIPLLARCLAGVEKVARESNDADELVGWSFLDSLCPEDLRRVSPWMGPRTLELADDLDPDAISETSRAPESLPSKGIEGSRRTPKRPRRI